MIAVIHVGGLGNQMFQYAFGRYLSLKYKTPLFLIKSIYTNGLSNRNFDLEIFKLGDVIIGETEDLNIYNRINSIQLNEAYFHFDEDLLSAIPDLPTLIENDQSVLLLSGYWQSYKYFDSIKDVIKKDFEFTGKLSGKWLELSKRIIAVNAVMINVRRGDYLQKLDYHGVVDVDYLFKAINYCEQRVKDPYFYVFSDDIPWCKKYLSEYKNLYFVDEQYYDERYEFYLQLMSTCQHFIISNSSFSWWAAWLSNVENKIVIAPEKWFAVDWLDTKDLTPKEWIRL